jgi:hypothetical protein
MKRGISTSNFLHQYRKIIPLCLGLGILFCFLKAGAQEKEFRQAEDSLKKYINYVHFGLTDNEKYAYNILFVAEMEKVLKDEHSFNYPFDSLIHVAKLIAPDESFRIINWNLALENGTYEYFGFIQVKGNQDFDYRVYKLTDKSDEIESPENMVLTPDRWFGALYYKIIMQKYRDKKYYTLLGWDGNNLLSTKKLIDVLSFKSNGKPQFGATIFRKYKDKEKPVRIIFEYSSKAVMILRYEKQYLHVIAQSRDKKTKKDKTRYESMIVFDHLVPMDTRLSPDNPDLIGQYQFYVPETNVLDGFSLISGRWYFTKDIDARNPKPPKKKKKLPQPDQYFSD